VISPAYGDKLYVLDTNVLSHDPAALFRFHEHAVFLPMAVLEALDEAKQGTGDLAQNVRQATRFLDDLLEDKDHAQIEFGIELPGPADGSPSGRLFFQTRGQTMSENGNDAGDAILASALEIKREHANTVVVLISKDINLRVKAKVMGLVAEDYYNDKVLDDVNLLYTGITTAGEAISSGLDTLKSWQQKERTFYRLPRAKQVDWMPGLCLRAPSNDEAGLIVREITDSGIVVAAATDHGEAGQAVWGVHARNDEQNFALNLLLDPEYDFVSLLGTAGTGKTLLALAAGLTQTFEEKRYREIVMTRVTVSVGEDIGYLPGTEEEKMAPWMGALMDNLEVLGERSVGGDWGRAAGQDLLRNRVKIRSVNFMRGRTFLNRYIIIDEAQNLTRKQIKTLVTRAGPGTKVVCIGNVAQIDTPYLSETTSGLTYVVDRFKSWSHSGHVTLQRGERSRLADFAAESL